MFGYAILITEDLVLKSSFQILFAMAKISLIFFVSPQKL